MIFQPKNCIRLATAALIAGFATMLSAPASAQNFFESLFGLRTVSPAPSTSAYGDSYPLFPNERSLPTDTGRPVAFCVRLCDGKHFPIQRQASMISAQASSSLSVSV